MDARDVAALGDGEAEVEVAERARLQPQAAAAAAVDERRRPSERSAAAKAEPCECDEASVPVPCHLLREVIAESCCPLHLRLELARVLSAGAAGTFAAGLCKEAAPRAAALPAREAASRCAAELEETREGAGATLPAPCCEGAGATLPALCCEGAGLSLLAGLNERCLMAVTSFLPFTTVLEVRACGREPLQWAMHTGASEEAGRRHWVHDRVRVRVCMRRIEDLTAGTRDESVFETRMRSLVDEALRSRLEEQIRAIQTQVCQRIEQEEQCVRRLVEKRVQQELVAILTSEVVTMQAIVEECVRDRVIEMFQRQIRELIF